jgi:hypothetical protein
VTFRIEADSLHRLVYNSLLFDTKSAKAYEVCQGFIKMNTSDGQVYLEDLVELSDEFEMVEYHWIISAEESKLLENDLRTVEGVLKVEVFEDIDVLKVSTQNDGVGTYAIRYGEYAQQSELFDRRKQVRLYETTFTINPDRLRKLALLQPRDYPVDCELVLIDDIPTPVIQFTKGPSVRGTYATLKKV